MKTREMPSFLLLRNNSVTIGLRSLSISALHHQKQLIFCIFCLGCNLQYFYKYQPYHSVIQ